MRPPTTDDVAAFLARQGDAAFSYPETGRTRDDAARPPGYDLDHNRAAIGRGEEDFARACAAMRAWRMFPEPWTRIGPVNVPQRVGETVAMQARAFGVWWLNAARIVYTLDEAVPTRRFGFAYGTLEAHVEQGEERFSVELHADGTVWYDLRAFSRPRLWIVRLAKPLARRLQMRFVRESQMQMRRAVENSRS